MTKPIRALPSALEQREAIGVAASGRRLAVFLDYDGTLVPIAQRPQDAVLPEATRDVVRRLAGRCPVAIISGRDRPDVERLVGIADLVYAGSHGFDIGSPGGTLAVRQEGAGYRRLLAVVIERLHRELDPIPGSLIEPKAFSVAVHYRRVAGADHARVRTVVEAVLAEHPELRATPGKMIHEIQPRIDWDKGKAVLHVLRTLDLGEVVPVFLGDDVTDEDAFRAVGGVGGIGIVVEDGEDAAAGRLTDAHYRLRDPDEVVRFLDGLAR